MNPSPLKLFFSPPQFLKYSFGPADFHDGKNIDIKSLIKKLKHSISFLKGVLKYTRVIQ